MSEEKAFEALKEAVKLAKRLEPKQMSETEKAKQLKEAQDFYDKEVARIQKAYDDETTKAKEYFDKAKEGEFKKRFMNKAFIEATNKGTCIELTEAYPILDEAKKEFPNKADAIYWAEYGIGMYPPNKFLKDKYISDIHEWRKKWFGEVKTT